MLTKQQALAHVATVQFKLKDYDKTYAKYANYKTAKRLELDVTVPIDEFVNSFDNNLYSYNRGYELSKKLTTKANIRQFKTVINSKIYELMQNHIDWYTDSELNKNELRCFTTRMYIENYVAINNAMQELLQEYVEYCYE